MSTPSDDRRAPVRAPEQVRPAIRRFAPILVIVGLIVLAYGFGLHRQISFESLVRNRAAVDGFIAGHMVAAVAGYIALYIAVISLSIPGGVIMTVTGGFLFGPLVGTVAAAIGALTGATFIFLIARSAAGDWLTRRAGPFAAKFAEGFRADAFNYLLFLRLTPFPFWLINLAAALFGVRLSTFVTASAIGILPATVTFAVFGAGLGSVIGMQEAQYKACVSAGRAGCTVNLNLSHVLTPTLLGALAAFAVLALIPVFARRIFGRKIDNPPERL